MEWFTTAEKEKEGATLIKKEGKVEIYQKQLCYYLYYNNSVVRYDYDLDELIEKHFNRLVDLYKRGVI